MATRVARALEFEAGAFHAAAAGNLFAHEASMALSQDAFDELFLLASDDEVPAWSRRWFVDAPRFQEEALTMRALAQLDGVESRTWQNINRTIGAHVPEAWLDELVRLNDLKVLENFLEDGRPAIASERQVRKETASLNLIMMVIHGSPSLSEEFMRRYRTEGEPKPRILADIAARPVVVQELARRRKKWLEETVRLVRSARAQALKSESILAPIGADPLRESRDQFEERARYHWDSRVAHAESLGFKAVKPRPSLDLHVRWLVRYQLMGEGFAQIARGGRSVSSGAAVAVAVRSVAGLIGLSLRPAARGGNRRRRAATPHRKK